jgi:hypothetical protein
MRRRRAVCTPSLESLRSAAAQFTDCRPCKPSNMRRVHAAGHRSACFALGLAQLTVSDVVGQQERILKLQDALELQKLKNTSTRSRRVKAQQLRFPTVHN